VRINNQGFTFISEVRKNGFTFIELLVSITIILVLTSIGMVSYQSANKGARDNKRKADLEQVRAALEMYRTDNDVYPAALSGLTTDYLSEIPTDPKGYSYYYNRITVTSYDLCAYCEGDEYVDDCGANCSAPADCNYKLTNP